jgi:hypothetical protein
MNQDAYTIADISEYLRGATVERIRKEGNDLYLELSDFRVMIIEAPVLIAVMRYDARMH